MVINMRMFLLSSDEDTLTGFRLAGVEGTLVQSEDELLSAFSAAESDESVGIVLVTRSLSSSYPSLILQKKKSARLLITEIPDMKDPCAGIDSITSYVRDAVGIQV